MRVVARTVVLVAAVAAVAACNRSAPPAPTAPAPTRETRTSSSLAPGAASGASNAHAEVGAPAPDFSLVDLDGKTWSLHELRGKTVVLEWFNPECPFVRLAHTKGSLVTAAKKQTEKGVVWLAINSAAPGKQGFGPEKNAEGKKRYGMENPVLEDTAGDVGHAYGAMSTPHMFVIDPHGVLVYKGAIDNSPDGEGQSPDKGKLVSYVDDAIDALQKGQPVAVKETRAYGCSVKYGK